MSSWWKTAKDILKGKAKGSKLIVLGIFLVSIGAILSILYSGNASVLSFAITFSTLGALAFGTGLSLYVTEAKFELKKKKSES